MFSRLKDERGFTLVELLVVVLIIGILAAIALPSFLGQREKGQDAAAKSNARNAVSLVKSCMADKGDYTSCNTTTTPTLLTSAGLPGTTGTTAVTVTSSANTFKVEATSVSTKKFTYEEKSDGTVEKLVNGAGSW